jgi:YgiT-type zinc finger domain-containing protein
MNCLVCRQAELVDGFTSVILERGEMRLVVNQVPARVCPNCGEAYVEEDIVVRLLREAEEVSTAGIIESEIEYS